MSETKKPDPTELDAHGRPDSEQLRRRTREFEAWRRARRAELAETRAYLESVAAEDRAQEVFLAYLLGLVEELEPSGGSTRIPRAEVYRLALRAFVPLAGRDWMRQQPPGEVVDPEDAQLLAEARRHRRQFAAGRPPGAEEEWVGEMMRRLCESLEIYILNRQLEGRDACLALLNAITDFLEEDADRLLGWVVPTDEQPCYVRALATAPQAFLGPAPVAARLADAAAARAFLEGVEPELVPQRAFRAGGLALVEQLEHDLEAGEVDPDWEELLWRLLRAFLPLADPAWVAAHRVLPETFRQPELREVESLGGWLAEARPGQLGGRADGSMLGILGAVTSAFDLYFFGRCAAGGAEMKAVQEAYDRYAHRDLPPAPSESDPEDDGRESRSRYAHAWWDRLQRFDEAQRDALRDAVHPIVERISRDALRHPRELRPLFSEVLFRLGDRRLTAYSVRLGAGIEDSSILKRFGREVGLSLTDYIHQRQRETTVRLVATSDLTLEDIASMLGYASERAISNIVRWWSMGGSPADLRRAWRESGLDMVLLRWAQRGDAGGGEAGDGSVGAAASSE